MKNLAILGSTGSIGRSALEVVAGFPDRFRVAYLTAHRNLALLKEQVGHFRPRGVVVPRGGGASGPAAFLDGRTEVLVGEEGLREAASREDVDLVLNALVGCAGLRPTLAAAEAGKDIALANKESLVVAGEIVMRTVRERGVRLLPIDSEHSAVLQCLRGEEIGRVRRLILTASGGPFLRWGADRLESVTVAEALAHPTWRMGPKISIDSATLMNKGLEVIEAFWLFGLPPEKIQVVIHPQSIIHSMVEFVDGSIKAQMGEPDMKLPIQYALLYPERPPRASAGVDFVRLGGLTFLAPDTERFRCLPLALRALAMGGTAPAVLNAANETAVRMFLEERIPFSRIPSVIQEALDAHTPVHGGDLEQILRADAETRARCENELATHR
ncbi:MAG: 1-deoxy-D-xylulose-5-phosphate reductoisomerase [Bacteroidota bacterium]